MLNNNNKKITKSNAFNKKLYLPKKRLIFKKRSKFPSKNKINDASFKHNISLLPRHKRIDDLKNSDIRFIALGGFEEVGRNMFALETKNDIFIFDAGFQFTSEIDTPGIDYILPNTQYLEDRKEKIRALIITHGHLDHIGGIPFIMNKLGNPPIYTRKLTSLLILKRTEEFITQQKLKINLVEPGDRKKIGNLILEFFNVTHSIPDSMGISVETPKGNIVISGDLKLRHIDGKPVQEEVDTWTRIGNNNNILMISDSTNCENPGWSLPETTIHKNVEEFIKNAPSRVIIAAFASQFERMVAFVKSAEKLGKKIILEGRSVKVNLEIAETANYFKPQKDTIIKVKDIDKYPSERIVMIVTGGQGEEFAALPRIARGDHKFIKLNKLDTVILSASVIPGNEKSIRNLMDKIMKQDAKIIHYKTSDVHSTGHGNAEELAWIARKVNPKFFIPGYAFHSMIKVHKKIVVEKAGIPEENVVILENGSILELQGESNTLKYEILKRKASCSPVMVDGYSISDLQHAVIGDRKLLSKDGFINIIVLIDASKRKIQKSPDILSRGFIYLRESKHLLGEIRGLITRLTEEEILRAAGGKIEVDNLKVEIHKRLDNLILRRTNKNPIIMPVVLVI